SPVSPTTGAPAQQWLLSFRASGVTAPGPKMGRKWSETSVLPRFMVDSAAPVAGSHVWDAAPVAGRQWPRFLGDTSVSACWPVPPSSLRSYVTGWRGLVT